MNHLDVKQIEEIIPHRHPFLLVDYIEDYVPGEYAVGYKCVTFREDFFKGHFPQQPVMPGVLIVEALAQTGAVAILSQEENKGKIAFFGGISVLGSVFSNIDKVSKYKLIFMTAIIGFIMFNLIYMLLHSISKITKNRIGVDIEADYCWGCRENYFIKCLATKYPIVFIYNSATIIICIFTFLAYICDKYNFITFIIESVNIIPDKMSFIPVVGCALLAILLFILYLLNKKFSPLKKISCHGNRRTHGCG